MNACKDGSVGNVVEGSTARAGTRKRPGLEGRDKEETVNQEVAQIKGSFKGWEEQVREDVRDGGIRLESLEDSDNGTLEGQSGRMIGEGELEAVKSGEDVRVEQRHSPQITPGQGQCG